MWMSRPTRTRVEGVFDSGVRDPWQTETPLGRERHARQSVLSSYATASEAALTTSPAGRLNTKVVRFG